MIRSFFVLFFILTGCGESESINLPAAVDSKCPNKSAQIEVQDGFSRRICGCNETGTDPNVDAALTCTVSNGTTVLFLIQGNKLNHQIRSTGSNAFPPSDVVGPLHPTGIKTHSITFDKTGTYQFVDQFQNNIAGQIVVQ